MKIYSTKNSLSRAIHLSVLIKFNKSVRIGGHMKLGPDRSKLLVVILLISVLLLAVSIITSINLWITIVIGIIAFFTILLIVIYGYEDNE
jgi:hypothetical protein